MEQKPIKRDPSIVEFSKDHHFALLLCWKIREGIRKTIEPTRISQYVVHFFDNDLSNHFSEEENLLFSQLSEKDPLRVQAEDDHAQIRKLVENIRKNKDDETLLVSFADLLDKHIRFEEREFFQYLENTLTKEQLKDVYEGLEKHPVICNEEWRDPFWTAEK